MITKSLWYYAVESWWIINAVTIVIVVDCIWLWMKTSWDIMGTCSWNSGDVGYFNLSMYVFAVCILDVSLFRFLQPIPRRRAEDPVEHLHSSRSFSGTDSGCQSARWTRAHSGRATRSQRLEPPTGWRNWEPPKQICVFWNGHTMPFLTLIFEGSKMVSMHLQNWAPQGEIKQRTTARDICMTYTYI